MTYKGRVQGGVVVLEPGARLDEGVEVVVEEAESARGASLADRLGPVIGKAKGLPADAARNVDRDLYGQTRP